MAEAVRVRPKKKIKIKTREEKTRTSNEDEENPSASISRNAEDYIENSTIVNVPVSEPAPNDLPEDILDQFEHQSLLDIPNIAGSVGTDTLEPTEAKEWKANSPETEINVEANNPEVLVNANKQEELMREEESEEACSKEEIPPNVPEVQEIKEGASHLNVEVQEPVFIQGVNTDSTRVFPFVPVTGSVGNVLVETCYETEAIDIPQPFAPPVFGIVDSRLQPVGSCLESPATSNTKTSLASGAKGSSLDSIQKEPEVAPLYPCLSVPTVDFKPFSEDQLQIFYSNPQLRHLEHFVESFIQNCHQERHELYELLLSYYKARSNLEAVRLDVSNLLAEYARHFQELWITSDHVSSVQAVCSDSNRVNHKHAYQKIEFNSSAKTKVERALTFVHSHVHNTLILCAYTAQLTRLQIESYVHCLFDKSPALKEIDEHAPIIALLDSTEQNVESQAEVERLKQCISVIFMFVRRPLKDEEFVGNLKRWLHRMVAALLRVAKLEDHLFLLHHLLRCPAGIGHWAAPHIQILLPPITNTPQELFGGPLLDHFLTMLSTLMMPVKSREEFLSKLKVALTPEANKSKDVTWTLIDEEGEEDENPDDLWLYLHENDLVSFLAQFPFGLLFKYLLKIDDAAGGTYTASSCSSQHMLKLLAFSSQLIQVLVHGLSTYSQRRYKQFTKHVGRLIRHTVQYVSDHWLGYCQWRTKEELLGATGQGIGPAVLGEQYSMDRLQVEVDHFFLRTTQRILSTQRFSGWQIMTDMPYTAVSATMMWRLLWLLYSNGQTLSSNQQTLEVQDIKSLLQDYRSKQAFQERLTAMPTSEVVYLLTTLANMTVFRSQSELDYVQAIILEVYEVSYISLQTREFCCKVGRDLLASILQSHPNGISLLLKQIKETLPSVGMMSVHLLQELPLHLWQPSFSDTALLREWLLNTSLSSPESQLSRIALTRLNWGFTDKEDSLALDLELHRQVAVLAVEAVLKLFYDEKMEKMAPTLGSHGGLISEGVRQISKMAGGLKPNTQEQELLKWSWELVFKLQLHQLEQPAQGSLTSAPESMTSEESFVALNLHTHPGFHPVQKAVLQQVPMACYLALTATTIGHSTEVFLTEGLNLLECLLAADQHRAALHALALVTPMFFSSDNFLFNNLRYKKIIQSLVHAGANNSSRNLNQMIISMIMVHIQKAGLPRSNADSGSVIEFWLLVLTTEENWYQDNDTCCILDNLCKAAFRCKGGIQIFETVLHTKYKVLLGKGSSGKRQGVLSSILSWVSSPNPLPSFLENNNSKFAWLSFFILSTENKFEEDSGLRNTLWTLLLENPDVSTDDALKRAIRQLKLPFTLSTSNLLIFRWVQLALTTQLDHPLLPLIWQKFFLLYLGRRISDSPSVQNRGVGERFFSSMANVSFSKKLKRRLMAAADHHHEAGQRVISQNASEQQADSQQTTDNILDLGEVDFNFFDSVNYRSSTEFHKRLVMIYKTYSLWLEEPQLQAPSVYLPALPPQYDATRLKNVFAYEQDFWLELVDLDSVDHDLAKYVSDWVNLTIPKHRISKQASLNFEEHIKTVSQRITERICQYEERSSPPAIVPIKSPVPEITKELLGDTSRLLAELEQPIRQLTDYAKLYSDREANHTALDSGLLEIVPNMFHNEDHVLQVQIPCRSVMGVVNNCKGPANATIRFQEKTADPLITRQVEDNRREYSGLIQDLTSPPPLAICSSAVCIENTLTLLIGEARQSLQSDDTAVALWAMACQQTGVSLFYHLVNVMDEATKNYPPTRQFFTSCLEILGQEFIQNKVEQADPLLELILFKPNMAGLLAPHFTPSSCHNNTFITMYQKVALLPKQHKDLSFMLLTKFDVPQWLNQCKPMLSMRSQLIEVIGKALCGCGLGPEDEIEMLFEKYRTHLNILFLYQFPDHYGDTLKFLLNASESSSVSVECWVDMLKSLGCPYSEASPSSLGNYYVQCIRHTQLMLTTEQIKETMEWLSSFFCNQRMNNQEAIQKGLYSVWLPYIRPLAVFTSYFSLTLIVKESERLMSVQLGAEQVVEELWARLCGLFGPWLVTMEMTGPSGPHLAPPWVENDVTVAAEMMDMFTQSVQCLQTQFSAMLPVGSRNALSLLWPFYVSSLVGKTQQEHVLRVYHGKLATLPWEQFHPNINDLELMIKVHEECYRSCFTFLAHIFPQMKWLDIVSYYHTYDPPEIVMRLHICLLTLLIMFTRENTVLETSPALADLLVKVEGLQWAVIDMASYENIVQWQLDNCQPTSVLPERKPLENLSLRLLRAAAGFGSANTTLDDSTAAFAKQGAYLRCVSRLLCRCSVRKEIGPDSYKPVISRMLNDIESVTNATADLAMLTPKVVSLLMEVYSLLNNCSPHGHAMEVMRQALGEWVAANPCSPLVLPTITAASQTLASLTHMVALIETSIDAHFNSGMDMGTQGGWEDIVKSMEVPEMNRKEFVAQSLKAGGYCTLYAYVIQRLGHCQNLHQRLMLLSDIIDWNVSAKPSSENEFKLFLWWDKAVEFCLDQVDSGAPHQTLVRTLNNLVPVLITLGEDKSSSGLLGAIGLGRKSSLSLGFRVAARSLATFLLAQMPGDNFIRLQPDAPGCIKGPHKGAVPSSKALQLLANLEALRASKNYLAHRDHVQFACDFITSPAHSLRDGRLFMALLVQRLFPDKKCLAILKNQ